MITTKVNTGVTGVFYFKDPITGDVQHEFKNKITDWGMARLAGHSKHDLWAFAENFYYLYFGANNSVTGTDNHTLVSLLADRSADSTAKYEVRHKADSKTKTEFYFDAANNLVIEFYQTFKVYFYNETIIKEIGIGPAASVSGGVPAAPFNIDQDGLPLTPNGFLGSNKRNHQIYPGFVFTDSSTGPRRDTHNPTPNHSIFSRASISGPLGVKYNAGDETDVTYKCTLTVSKDVAQLKDGLLLDVSGVASPSPSNQLSDNKSIIRTFPFYKLDSARKPSNNFQGLISTQATWTGQTGAWWAYEGNLEDCPPFFENLPYDKRYPQTSGITPTGVQGGYWLLDFYNSEAFNSTHGTITNTITALTNSIIDSTSTPIPLPLKSQKIHTTTAKRPGTTFIPRNEPNSGPGGARITDYEFYEQITDREPTLINYTNPTPDIWQTDITFQLATDQLNRAGGAIAFTLWRACSPNQQMKEEWRGYGGLTTVLSGQYIPQVGKILTMKYTLTWTRI